MQNNTTVQPNEIADTGLYDILPLPSEGMFYESGVKEAKVYYLTAEDEGLMTSVNIRQSGNLIDEILKRKVRLDGNMDHSDLTTGDRLAIIIYLRINFEPIYRLNLVDDRGNSFKHDFDLSTLTVKPLTVKPVNGLFEWTLPKSGWKVKFRLLTGKDEKFIREMDEQMSSKFNSQESKIAFYTHQQQIVEIDGITDKAELTQKIRTMPLMDGRRLAKYIEEITPSINTKIQVASPFGGTFRGNLPFTSEFLYPSI